MMTTFLSWFLLRELIQVRVWIALLVTYSGVLVLYAHEASLSGSDVSRFKLFPVFGVG